MLKNRRTFIRQSGSLTLGSLFFAQCASPSSESEAASEPVAESPQATHELGVQLYTLMAIIDQDTQGTLKKVADLGYKNLESAFSRQGGFYGKSAKEFAAMVKDLGLNWQAHHVLGAPLKLPPGREMPKDENGKPLELPAMPNLKENMQQLVDDAAAGGLDYLVCANIPVFTEADVDDAVNILTQTGEACNKAGLQLIYHNHDWEFNQIGDTTPYEVFLSQIPADLMKMELDLAWVTKAEVDPVELFEKHPGRFPLWHVKDIAEDMLTLKPVGQGTVDFKRIFEHAETAGLKYPYVEHDRPDDAFASLQSSIEYLNTNIL